MNHCQMTTIPPGLFQPLNNLLILFVLPSLIFLFLMNSRRLYNNFFTQLPEGAFLGLTSITILDLTACSIQMLPTALGVEGVASITELKLGYNRLTYLGRSLRTMPNLANMYVRTLLDSGFKLFLFDPIC